MSEVFVDKLLNELEAVADPQNVAAMRKYMRNQFEFYGIKTPLRRSIMQATLVAHPIVLDTLEETLFKLYEQPQREAQYVATDLLSLYARQHQLEAAHASLIEHLVRTKSWWDTVDPLAVKVVGPLFAQHTALRDDLLPNWRQSDSMWIRRTVLIHQLSYKQQTDEALLRAIIEEQLGSQEFFIQKAIGWALREYSYTNPDYVLDLCDTLPLSSLSRREALKGINRKTKTLK